MPILRLKDNSICTNLHQILNALAPLNIQIRRYPIRKSCNFFSLLEQHILSSGEKEQLLNAVQGHFEQVKHIDGYKWRDLLLLHPGSPNIYSLIAGSDRCHTHRDNKAIYILAGEAILGFVCPDGSQVELILQPEEYIHIPRGTEHWFRPTTSLQLKAVRYFTSLDGWIPKYTDTRIGFYQAAA